ncbi:type-F conjugative transfer system pilin assembly protein TrbC [Pantoea cypripedii]|uniref:type-F conjugative transfer system pilin assembly protein TrbC n=1 Tax=Pantoea cypripedii TaxID=55209 RepID=UPI000A11D843|nr:type-F conjugative transfer system pilin assembly protein TrbC [Pantoea cypripedii]MBP2199059.1 conjugal transfer pilus assembly protein TrbC [Pantoea cypripedii]
MEKTQLCCALTVALGLLLATISHAKVSQIDATPNESAYFLSTSIPEKQLALLIKAAESHNIPVYLRGLVDDSMEQTAKYMLHLVSTYHVSGVQIDPVRFDYYGVQQVPALVKKCGERFDIIYGNIALNDALTLLDQRGECRALP